MSQITINIDNKNGNTSISIYSNGDVDVNDVPVEEVKYGWKMKSLTWVHKTQGFGERLRQARREHLYTQQSLADKLGVTQSAVTEWEKGRAFPKQERIEIIADLLDTTAETLLGVTPEENQ